MPILRNPRYTVIEQTAASLAATVYEAGRSSGMTSKYPNARAYAKAYLEKYIPKAIDLLITIMGDETKPKLMRDEIYHALMERQNAPGLEILKEELPAFKLPENWIPQLIAKKEEKRNAEKAKKQASKRGDNTNGYNFDTGETDKTGHGPRTQVSGRGRITRH